MRKSESSFSCQRRRRTEPSLPRVESLQQDHWATTAWARPKRACRVGLRSIGNRYGRPMVCGSKQIDAKGQKFGTAPMSEKPEVPDAHKASRQYVKEEAA